MWSRSISNSDTNKDKKLLLACRLDPAGKLACHTEVVISLTQEIMLLIEVPLSQDHREKNDNITIEFMFAGINMFWARLRLIEPEKGPKHIYAQEHKLYYY